MNPRTCNSGFTRWSGPSARIDSSLTARPVSWRQATAAGRSMSAAGSGRSSLRPAELFVEAAGMERRPGLIRARGSVILVELHERMDEVTADGTGAEQIG